jgi:hypothetical protein
VLKHRDSSAMDPLEDACRATVILEKIVQWPVKLIVVTAVGEATPCMLSSYSPLPARDELM